MLAWRAWCWPEKALCLSFGTLFDLRFCVGLRVSFVDVREPSMGLRSSRLVALCRPERTLFQSESDPFRPKRALRWSERALRLPERALCWPDRDLC